MDLGRRDGRVVQKKKEKKKEKEITLARVTCGVCCAEGGWEKVEEDIGGINGNG